MELRAGNALEGEDNSLTQPDIDGGHRDETMILFGSLITYPLPAKSGEIKIFVYRDYAGKISAGVVREVGKTPTRKQAKTKSLPRAETVELDGGDLRWLLPRDGAPAPEGVGTGLMNAILQSHGDTIRGMIDDEWFAQQEQNSLEALRRAIDVKGLEEITPSRDQLVFRVERVLYHEYEACPNGVDQVWVHGNNNPIGYLCLPQSALEDEGEVKVFPDSAPNPH